MLEEQLENTERYAGVAFRVRAIITDAVVVLCFMILAFIVFSFFENVPDNTRILVFIFISFLYDPLLQLFLAEPSDT